MVHAQSMENNGLEQLPELTAVTSNLLPSTETDISAYEDTVSRIPESESQTTITNQPINSQPPNTGTLEYKKIDISGEDKENVPYRQRYQRDESECSEFCKQSVTCYGTCTFYDDWCVHDSYVQNYWGCICMCCTRGNVTTCFQLL